MAVIGPNGLSDITEMKIQAPVGIDISREGRYMAFDNCMGSARGIYTAQLDGSELKMVAPISGDYCVTVRWAPDGKKISYASHVDHQLHVIYIDSGIDKPIPGTSIASWHSWSPTADKIVYEHGRGGKRLLYITDLSGNINQLTYSKDFGNCESWAPDWSPDGNVIVFTSCSGALYTVAPDGTNLQQLASSVTAYSPRWSMDGNWVLFLSGKQLMRVQNNGENLTAIGELLYPIGPFSIAPLR